MVTKPENAQRAPTANRRRQRNKITYTPAPLPAEGFVRLPSVLGVLGVSKSTFLNGVKEGKYPAGTLLSSRCRVWPVADIRALLDRIGGA
jgi:prophage regulatory protein